jgi:hypothetical protein
LTITELRIAFKAAKTWAAAEALVWVRPRLNRKGFNLLVRGVYRSWQMFKAFCQAKQPALIYARFDIAS